MQDSEELPDDVPVADAVEQQRMPLEAAPPDWQEQLETVELDPEFEEFDR